MPNVLNLCNSPQLWGLDYLTPQTIKPVISPLELFKTGQITPQGGFVFFFFIYFS